MAEIFPFHAYRYDLGRVKLADVVTQPYDKITAAMQERYATLSPYNLIAVEKGPPSPKDSAADNVYTRAEKALQQWICDGVLVREGHLQELIAIENQTELVMADAPDELIREIESIIKRSSAKLIERRKSTTTLERLFLEATKNEEARTSNDEEVTKQK